MNEPDNAMADLLALIAERKPLPEHPQPPPVGESYPHKPLPSDETTTGAASSAPLTVSDASSNSTIKARIKHGLIDGDLADPAMAGGLDKELVIGPGTFYIYAVAAVEQDEATGLWRRTGDWSIGKSTSDLFESSGALFYVNIAQVTGENSRLTVEEQLSSGHQWIHRGGNPDGFFDDNGAKTRA